MKTILVLTDFKTSSENAVNYAAALAAQNQLDVVLLHVITSDLERVVENVEPEGNQDGALSYSDAMLGRLSVKATQMVSENAVSNVDYIVRYGDLVNTIQDVVEAKNIDLVVMGTHVPHSYMESSGNTNTSVIIDNLNCPILVVPETAKHLQLKNLTFATTLKEDQLIAFHFLGAMQKVLDCEVDILYLNDPANLYAHEGINTRLEYLTMSNGLKVNKVYTSMHADDMQKQLDDFVNDNHTDMLAVVAHRRKGLIRWILGSTTETALLHSTVPMLIFEPANLAG